MEGVLKVGVIGCGYWGPNLIRNLLDSGRCEEVFAYDLDHAVLDKTSRRFRGMLAATSAEEITDLCDAIVVCTPVASHHQIASAVMRAGKSVLVEKPITSSVAEALDLVHIAEEQKVTLMVGHTFIYSSPVLKVKDYIDQGQLGEIYFVSGSRVNLGLHRHDVNVIWDLAPHDLSMFMYWLGEAPCKVSAHGRACIGSHVDVATIYFEFPSGVVATLEVSWLAPTKLRRTVVVGSEKMVLYDDTAAIDKIKLFDSGATLKNPHNFGEFQLSYRTGDMLSPRLSTSEPLLAQVNHFLDCVETGAKPRTDGMSGLNIVLALEAACRSLVNEGRAVLTQDVLNELKVKPAVNQAAASR